LSSAELHGSGTHVTAVHCFRDCIFNDDAVGAMHFCVVVLHSINGMRQARLFFFLLFTGEQTLECTRRMRHGNELSAASGGRPLSFWQNHFGFHQ
jgi:hypothetical protein